MSLLKNELFLPFRLEHNNHIFPAQHSRAENEPSPPFVIDTVLYSQNRYYPMHAFENIEPKVFRDLRVANLSFFPLSFNPQSHQLNVLKNIILRADFVVADTQNTIPNWPTYVSENSDAMYNATIINYNTLGIPTEDVPSKCLIISNDYFAQTLNPFIFWKRKKGLEVFLEIVGQPTPGYLKNLITNYYRNHNIDYVLLIGDGYAASLAGQIPQPLIPFYAGDAGYGYYNSDYWYSTIIGNDNIADIALGRFSVWTPEQLNVVINKTFAFERYPDEDWYIKRHDFVTCYEDQPDGYSFHDCKIESITPILEPHDFLFFDDWGGWSSNDILKLHINNSDTIKGSSMINYRGHGLVDRWDNWCTGDEDFTNQDIRELTNFYDVHNAWLPIVYEVCCDCGRAHDPLPDTTGHSECWLRHESGGGVAALGATGTVYNLFDRKFDTELYRVPFGDFIPPITQELGWVINTAKVKAADAYGWDPFATHCVKAFHLLGDPEIDIYTAWNGYVSATHLPTTTDEPQNFEVYVNDENSDPLPYALVCLYQQNALHETRKSDESGLASFWITPQPGNLHVTATKHNHGPHEGICRVIPIGNSGPQSVIDTTVSALDRIFYDPVARVVNILYHLAEASRIEITAYDVTGRIASLVEKSHRHKGFNRSTWRCFDNGCVMSKGIYFIRCKAEEFDMTKKVVVY